MGNLLRKELAERGRATAWMAVLSPVVLLAPAWLLAQGGIFPGWDYSFTNILISVLLAQLCLLALVALLPTFAQEREQNTLELLYCQPLPRGQIWLAKSGAGFLRLAIMGTAPLLLASSLVVTWSAPQVFATGTAAVLAAGCVVLLASSLAPATYSAALFAIVGLALHGALLGLAVQDAALTLGPVQLALVGLLVTAPPCLLTSYLVVAHPSPRWLMAIPPWLQGAALNLCVAGGWLVTAAAAVGVGYLLVHA